MKQLTKIRIINWHYFWDETIDVKPLVFLTGVNGSGKSTLIDALQVVLLGDASGRYFNKAALEKSARTLKGYLRGELGDTADGGFKYLRDGEKNGRFTTYIALEFHDDFNNNDFVMGVCIDSYPDGSNDAPHFFFLEGQIPVNNFVVNNVPMDYKTLLAYFKENYRSDGKDHFIFFDTAKQYRDFLKTQLGGLKDKYFSLLKKATSFTPITDITTFITEYVCDQQADINLDTLQDNINQYKKLEDETVRIEKRIARLEEIHKAYESYTTHKENFTIANYIIEKCKLEQNYNTLRNYNKTIQKSENRIKEIEGELEEFANDLKALDSRKHKLISDRASNDTIRMADSLKEEMESNEAKIRGIEGNIDLVKSSLSLYAANFSKAAIDLLDDVNSIDLSFLDEDGQGDIEEIKASAKLVKNSCARFEENELNDLSLLNKDGLSQFRDTLVLFKQKVSNFTVSLAKNIEKVDKQIRELRSQKEGMQSGTKPYDRRLTYIKDQLEARLEQQFNKHIEVSIFADLVDIEDLSWSNAIEGLLYSQKFNLFVPPKYYDDAYKILRKLLQDIQFYGTALVDEEKIIERDYTCQPGSLAEEIKTDHEGARAYTNFLIGRVHKSADTIEARESGNGITKECDLYRNFSMSRLNPRTYQESFIGRNIDERFVKEKSKQLQESDRTISTLRRIKGLLDGVNMLEIFTSNEMDNIFLLLKNINDLPGLKNNVAYIENELKNSDSSLTKSVDNRLKEVEDDINSLNQSRDKMIQEKATLQNEITNIRNEKIITMQNEIKTIEDSINSRYNPFLVSEKALPLYDQLINDGNSVIDILSKFNVESSRLQYIVNNVRNEVFKLRRDYLTDYHLSYDPEDESNEKFDEELVDFRDVKLPDYKAQIQDSYEKATKQFKDDFIFKLRSAIEDVEDQIANLNEALKQSAFGRDIYTFTVKPSAVYRRYYDMLKDDLVINGGKDDSEFINRYKDVMEDLFKQIIDVGNKNKEQDLVDNIAKFTDYRSYLDFDLIVYNKDSGDEQRLSKMIKKKSGGETQTPFYIAVLASFAQLYHVKDDGILGNTSRLIIFDEAFSKMDKNRMTEAIKLLNKFSLQVILSAPSDKIQDISPLVDETLIVLHDKNRSCVRLFAKEDNK